ncbi:hypothetical protein [Candidatus Protofrankia californiensis]|uniref:hypothetical protein n=1 Tax=Candidatus Protofrankia californiensis TaxID=1839754 RepID=UPI0013EBBE92|nr:hypothetical protein [Candidatus Protofrankia californiensis]
MNQSNERNHALITEEIERLPQGFDDLSEGFLVLVAALRLHGFSIQRADEAKEPVDDSDDLWAEMGSPSVWIYARSALELSRNLRKNIEQRNTPEYMRDSNRVIRANLEEQRRLLGLLEEFYAQHTPVSFHARLIVETIDDQGESYLKPQGASVRVIMGSDAQKKWRDEGQTEMLAFAKFLADKL